MDKERGGQTQAVERLRRALDGAQAVVVGAGAGLSTSAGMRYAGERFDRYFRYFGERYGFADMYTGGFYPFPTEQARWAYWSRMIYINRYMRAPRPVYEALHTLLRGKDAFVLTTNVDHCFQRAGFDKDRLFYTQGDYGLWQCSAPCHRETYDNEAQVRRMLAAQGFAFAENGDLYVPEGTKLKMEVPAECVPRCPRCGRPMRMNLRADETFVEDAGWHRAAERYASFLRRVQDKRVLFWELGVGYNTPGIIKFSFWRMTQDWPGATYACLNRGEAYVPEEIGGKSICIDADIGDILARMAGKTA